MGSHKCFVWDIDATLVHTHDKDYENNISIQDKFAMLDIFADEEKFKLRKKLYTMKIIDVSEPGHGRITFLTGIFRPYLQNMIDYMKVNNTPFVIWSAGTPKYVHKMAEIMFPEKDFQPEVVYTSDDCEMEKDNKGEITTVIKPLEKLFKDKRLKGKFNEKNTLVIDDREDTFSRNPKNGIQIPEFESDLTVEDISDHSDINLAKLMAWLETKEVKECTDVRKLKKNKIFQKKFEDYIEQIINENEN